MTCAYLAAMLPGPDTLASWDSAEVYPVDALDDLLDAGADVARSMWDRESLLIYLDIDYTNADAPGEAFTHPAEVFFKLEPTYRAARRLLAAWELPLRAIVTGGGYHFVGSLPLDDPLTTELARLHPTTPAWAGRRTGWGVPGVGDGVDAHLARAYAGLGLVMEYLGQRILREAAERSPIPVVLNGTISGPVFLDRETVSIDLSFAGDPLDIRHLRMAYGAYQRHRWRPDLMGAGVSERAPVLIAVPRGGLGLEELLRGHRLPGAAVRRAERHSARIPVVRRGMATLLAEYLRSPVARLHDLFHAEPVCVAPAPPAWFEAEGPEALPSCVRACLETPNARLLEPTGLQHVTRALLGRGWSPRRIAGLIQFLYTEDHGWGRRWDWQDRQTRAEFYVRVFSTLLLTGEDEAIDFNCVSAQEKGLCPRTGCPHDLRVDRQELLRRVAS